VYVTFEVFLFRYNITMATTTVTQTVFHPFERKMQQAAGIDLLEIEALGECEKVMTALTYLH